MFPTQLRRELTAARLAIALFVLAHSVNSGTTTCRADEEGASNLRVITYNVQFLPGLARFANKRKEPEYRAKEIGRLLSDYDLIGLNEVFDDTSRNSILNGIRQAWENDFHVITGPVPHDGRYNGGLAIVSRYPFLETHSHIYTVASSPKDYGLRADGFVAKGVLHARIWKGSGSSKENFIDVFVTHLEARVEKIRHQQFTEFAAFVAKHTTPSQPVLMMGDFNTRGNPVYREDESSAYHLLLTTISQEISGHQLIDLWPTLKTNEDGGTSEQEEKTGGRRIDYIFVAKPLRTSSTPQPAILKASDIRVNRFLDDKVGALSDHSAVEAEFEWLAQ